MNKYIVCCDKCNKMFKCDKKDNNTYITDYGDVISNINGTYTCISCNNEMNPTIMKTQDWIANKVFTIKGEKF